MKTHQKFETQLGRILMQCQTNHTSSQKNHNPASQTHYHKSLGKNIWQEEARNKPEKLCG